MVVELSPRKRDPLRNFNFTVYVPDTSGALAVVGGVQRISGFGSNLSSYEVWEGGNNLHRYANPDKLTWDPVTLEQGILLDDTLELWALGVRHFVASGTLMTDPSNGQPVKVKRDVVIEASEPEIGVYPDRKRFVLHNAWISKFNALPRMDAMANEVALMLVELVHEGWVIESI
jgi:phage tail-like protein